jgi:hypothetical protein
MLVVQLVVLRDRRQLVMDSRDVGQPTEELKLLQWVLSVRDGLEQYQFPPTLAQYKELNELADAAEEVQAELNGRCVLRGPLS